MLVRVSSMRKAFKQDDSEAGDLPRRLAIGLQSEGGAEFSANGARLLADNTLQDTKRLNMSRYDARHLNISDVRHQELYSGLSLVR